MCSLVAFWQAFTHQHRGTQHFLGKHHQTPSTNLEDVAKEKKKPSYRKIASLLHKLFMVLCGRVKEKEKRPKECPIIPAHYFLFLHPSDAASRSQPKKGLVILLCEPTKITYCDKNMNFCI